MRKRLLYISFLCMLSTCIMLLVTACKGKKQAPVMLQNIQASDSLNKIIAQRDNEINDMMATLNQIEDGFEVINIAENRVNVAQTGEGDATDKAKEIAKNIKIITDKMQENRALISKLQKQLRQSSFKSQEFKRTIEGLMRRMNEKDQQLQELRAELDAKDIHISELDETIDNLNNNITDLQNESEQKTQTINSQDMQLNTAWYVFGTKSELKEQNILVGGKVLQASFNHNYFMKIDIRVEKDIKLYSKYAKILTTHPASSYTLQRDNFNQYVLHITNPQLFWSTSKYLVILVK